MSLALRMTFAVLSIGLLAVIGLLGDALHGMTQAALTSQCRAAGALAALPYPTRLLFDLYGESPGNFLLTLTPFMIAFGALAALGRGDARSRGDFFCIAAATLWLIALTYSGLFAWGLLLPMQTLCAPLETRPIAWAVLALDAILILAAIAAVLRVRSAD